MPRRRISAFVIVLSLGLAVAGGLYAAGTPRPAYACASSCGLGSALPDGDCQYVDTTTGTTTISIPSDWNNASNTIEAIGGGGGGAGGTNGGKGGTGGSGNGGGGYAEGVNKTLSGSIYVYVGAGGAGETDNTYIVGGDGLNSFVCSDTSSSCDGGGQSIIDGNPCGNNASFGSSVIVGACGGGHAFGGNYFGTEVGSPVYDGGYGVAGRGSGAPGGPGGGAGGPHGAGAQGSGTTGGTGDNGFGGSGGSANSAGSNGTEWSSSPAYGSGGGGGAGDASTGSGAAGSGGSYGAGGGGSQGSGNAGGNGAQGIIVITYTPTSSPGPVVTTDNAYTPTPSHAVPYASITDNCGVGITQHGFTYSSTDATLSTGVSTTTLGSFSGTGQFTGSLGSLSADTTYYYRAYAYNGSYGYGNILKFYTGDLVPVRHMRLFSGFRIKLVSGRLILLH